VDESKEDKLILHEKFGEKKGMNKKKKFLTYELSKTN